MTDSPRADEFAHRLFDRLDPDPATRERLHTRLVAAATRDDLLDVVHTTLDSPFGPLLVAATGRGLVKVSFEREGHDRVLEDLATRVGPRVLTDRVRLDDVARQLDEYFAGTRWGFDLHLDLRLAHGFRRDVVTHLPTIGYGHTASYGEVARAVGHPRASRAVGTACARNPLPLVVPCHRVVRADGSPGQYGGGERAKRWLLDLERGAG